MAQPQSHWSRGKMTQDFQVGSFVKVGFMKNLLVSRIIPTPGDFAPDAYELVAAGGVRYEFVPHKGLLRLEE